MSNKFSLDMSVSDFKFPTSFNFGMPNSGSKEQNSKIAVSRTIQIKFNEESKKEMCFMKYNDLIFSSEWEQIVMCNLPHDFSTNVIYKEFREKINDNFIVNLLNYHYEKKIITVHLNKKNQVFFNYNTDINIITKNKIHNFKASKYSLNDDVIQYVDNILHIYEKCNIYASSIITSLPEPNIEYKSIEMTKQNVKRKLIKREREEPTF